MAKPDKVFVTERAVVQRINRKLKEYGLFLKASRGAAAKADLGPFYVIDTGKNTLARCRFDLEAYARTLEVLAEWESLAE